MFKSLLGSIDFYRCMHIKIAPLPENFPQVLEQSITEWVENKIKAVWLLVPNSQLELVAVCHNYGFYPHHVNESGIMMAKWLENRPNALPTYSTHYVGVGGILFNENNQILLVKNRYSATGLINWRLPGGLVEPNELVCDAACREVLEETSVQSRPVGILGLREKKNYQFDRPDIYFLVLLEPLSFQHTMDPEEIVDCAWMDFAQWIDDEKPVDSRKMIRALYTDRTVPPFQWFQRLCMDYTHADFISPNYNATHYYHLQPKSK
jgi:ADP-ribose pyrophosphatase YjhB (NUDIX family)